MKQMKHGNMPGPALTETDHGGGVCSGWLCVHGGV